MINNIDPNNPPKILQGSIPTKALGLSEEMMYDSFGYQFSYVVSVDDSSSIKIIDNNIFSNWEDDDYSDKINLTNIQDETEAKYSLLIISHGENGNGAFYKGKIVKKLENSEEEGISNEISNSYDDEDSEKPNNEFYYGKKTSTFDDIVFFKIKKEMIDLVKKPTKALAKINKLLTSSFRYKFSKSLMSYGYRTVVFKNFSSKIVCDKITYLL